MHSIIRPNAWVAVKLPSGITRVLQVAPNTTISLGKHGAFPANLILGRPYHLTFELEDKRPGETFSRLRAVPPSELYAEVFADEEAPSCSTPAPGTTEAVITAADGDEFSLVDADSGKVVVRSNNEAIDDSARQTLTQEEIEELKRDGNNAGKDVIAKLLLSHTALDQKTSFSLAKYKLLKTKKYIRRFQVLPIDVPNFSTWQLEERDASRILDLRAEMMGLVGCWGNVHYGGEDVYLDDPKATSEQGHEACPVVQEQLLKGRWLVVDDTCGLLVAALAERMGVLSPEETDSDDEADEKSEDKATDGAETAKDSAPTDENIKKEVVDGDEESKETTHQGSDTEMADAQDEDQKPRADAKPKHHRPRASDFAIPFSQTNTITVVHGASQPNLSFLNYWGFDVTSPNHPPHPLLNHLLTLTWLQLLKPELDTSYSTPPLTASSETLSSWKPSRRGNFHRKRRRYARIRHIVDTARAGNFSGLVCASTMDPISIMKHALPLLAGGAPVSIYSPTIEPLTALVDCFSVNRRTAWTSGAVPEIADKSNEELEHWAGTEQFPLNPTLLLGTSIQTSRARRWQVLPGRTHPLMTERGGSDGFIFTGWKAKPAEGKVAAKGKFKRRKLEDDSAPQSEAAETPA
ncbi:Gcd10p family-domain-containing protein [Lasiosphaeria miniovina]|uniref:tRNA (adenine(58)-N(1))-methyltransferase non-catalytic subunit TRM6 n=1 Tax=Lasiosphaeria miniovina TaxID=1954250 RepID=A0AA40AAT4_9PEZI|nr:Gcd10p family-domain-containing protein [Lasiosphaeria miniovina]KAK0712442.1 Gcd10p family-domain-containing protein [Lasiosphaeria miniovina]